MARSKNPQNRNNQNWVQKRKNAWIAYEQAHYRAQEEALRKWEAAQRREAARRRRERQARVQEARAILTRAAIGVSSIVILISLMGW